MLITLILVSIFFTEYQQFRHDVNSKNQIKSSVQRELIVIRSILEADVYLDTFYANNLATIISLSPEISESQLRHLAQKTYRKSKHLKNIAIAPNDIIEFIYPVEGNKAALGLDYRTVPEQWETVTKARNQQSIFIAGPLELVQGGAGLIARAPIFKDPPNNRDYWGVCSVVLDLKSLFKDAGIYETSKRYNLAIRGKDGKGALGDVFFGDPAVFDSNYVQEKAVLPSGVWEIAISPPLLHEAFPFYQNYISRLIGYPLVLLVILIFACIYYLYYKAYGHSMRDALTLLPNRRYFLYALQQMISTSRKKGSSFVLLNIDVDDFKSVNDTYGHVIGDKLLIEIALRLKAAVRSSDIIARTGGDEYLVIIPRMVHEEDLQRVIATIKKSINEKPAEFGYIKIHTSVSIGYAIYMDEEMTAAELMTAADLSMYEDKKSKLARNGSL
nr:diguanylate cyclase [Shewanella gelidii]